MSSRRLLAAGVAVVLAVVGVALLYLGLRGNEPPSPPRSAAPSVPATGGGGDAASTGGGDPGPSVARLGLGRSVPVSLDIPAISVHSPVIRLGLARDGTMQVPPLGRYSPAGWYTGLAAPGEVGPAIIVGHVDSVAAGPAVFYRLGELRRGDEVSVRRADGRVAVFTVTGAARYPKSAFPGATVYGAVRYPALRLITCGGSFDRRSGHYRDSVVVYARLTASRPAG